MKKLIQGALAIALTASPLALTAAEAAPFQRDRQVTTVEQHRDGRQVVTRRTVVRQQPGYHAWRKGQRFDRRYARDYREIPNYRAYRLNTPPRGYHWVRSGNDAVLVALTSGVIGAVIANAVR